jgi:hypothetical protein
MMRQSSVTEYIKTAQAAHAEMSMWWRMSMGEQIRIYGVRRMDLHFHGDLCTDHKCEKVVLAEEHDREIAQRDARIVELEGDLNIARLERDAKLCTECPRGSVQAERDTAREMLRSAQKWMQHGTACNINQYGQRLADKSLVCSCGLDQFLASLPKEQSA